MSFKNYILCIVVLLFTTGCTFKTPEYKVDNNIVNKLNNYDLNKVSLSSDINEISDESNYKLKIRAVDMISSYGNNYSDYVYFSLKQQLSQNDIYKENSNVIIKTKLIQNYVDIWGFLTGSYIINVNFKIFKDGKIIYDKDIQNQHDFPSHFVGQIAIENAINNYPIAVQKVIAKFLTDEDTIKSIKK